MVIKKLLHFTPYGLIYSHLQTSIKHKYKYLGQNKIATYIEGIISPSLKVKIFKIVKYLQKY